MAGSMDAAAQVARVAPRRMPTTATRLAPADRITATASAMLRVQASTRPGSPKAPAESPVPS